ncbi:MAG: DUF1826 domain-containing protein [Paracoccaceae bacterium]
MNIATRQLQTECAGVEITDDATSLAAFRNQGCAAAVWQRHMPQPVSSWLADLDPEVLPRGRVVVPPYAVAQTVKHLCDMAALPGGDERAWLESDIVSLSDMFSSLMSAKYLRLRLDVVTTNACRKFHVDAITSRLVCTYRGTGTQYGTSENGNDPQRIFTVKTGNPILLRGTIWPPKPAAGLLHRSPPIEGSGETRFLLVLDPVSNPDA